MKKDNILPNSSNFNPVVDADASLDIPPVPEKDKPDAPINFEHQEHTEEDDNSLQKEWMSLTRNKLGRIINEGKYYRIKGQILKPQDYSISDGYIHVQCVNENGDERKIKFEADDFDDVFNSGTIYGAPKPKVAKPVSQPVSATTKSIRESLFEDLEKIRSGEMKPDKAKAISDHINSIVGVSKLELEYLKLMRDKGSGIVTEDAKKFIGEK